MKKIIISLFPFFFFLPNLYGAFKDLGFSARAVGMGGAFTGVSDDINAILYNPAGMCQIKKPEANLMYAKLYTELETVDLGLNYLAFVYPVGKLGNLGINWASFFSEQYRENMLSIAYAKSMNELSIGMNLKYLWHSYLLDERTINDPVFVTGRSKSNWTVDFGLFSKPISERVSYGIMLKNITQPDLGLKTKDIVPFEIRIGVAYKVKKYEPARNILLSFDFSYRNQKWGKPEDKFNFHFGIESWFVNEILGLRLGGHFTEFSFGASIKMPNELQVDYALLVPLEIEETISYMLALTYRF